MTIYSDTLTGNANLHDTPLGAGVYGEIWAETIKLHASVLGAYGLTLTNTLQLTSPLAYKWIAGAAIIEVIQLKLSQSPNVTYTLTARDLIRMSSNIMVGMPAHLTTSLTLHDTMQVVLAVAIVQKMMLGGSTNVNVRLGVAIADGLRFNAALAQFMNVSLDETLTLTSLLTYQYQAITTISDNLTLNELFGDSMCFSVIASEDITFADGDLLHMIYQGDELLDTLLLNALYVSPDGNFTTWAINTRTNAVSEYGNWVFNSFASMGRKYLGANSQGLYELNGERDDGVDILSMIQTGLLQLNGTKLAGLKGVYLGMKVSLGTNQFFVKLTAGDGREYVYEIKAQPNTMTTKVNVGKGLRARYFSFALSSTGPDFNLDTIEFVPMVGKRRV